MAIKTDDCDIRDVRFYMDHGGNGDFYINLIEYTEDGTCDKWINMRFAMSGGNAPHGVKMAIVALYRAMEKEGLNKHPKDELDALTTEILEGKESNQMKLLLCRE